MHITQFFTFAVTYIYIYIFAVTYTYIYIYIYIYFTLNFCFLGPRWRNGLRFARSDMHSYNPMKRYMDCRICQEIPRLLHGHQNTDITINNVKTACVAAFSMPEVTLSFALFH